ncbi:MAG: hypothetical protein XD43_0523 [Thermococcales archaeon 44_46]|nr:MAG: hypothetical protein XD43_0523 [Thermococcales archaeon 44_46]
MNYGAEVSPGQNAPEDVYLGVSTYTYHVGGCDTKVPFGLYIESQ